ncbi:MAG: Na+/H+ antiporter NhaA [Deltaproteobacteria bacterium]|nr:Na+/H+ antiporter NhaA [Deltaproteobacteria bacterium]
MNKLAHRGLRLLSEFSIPLISGVVVALIWANVAPESHEALLRWSPLTDLGVDGVEWLDFHFLVNDVFMAFFFGIATKEIVESVLPGGALNPPRKAVNPLLATLGGVLGPIAVYLVFVLIRGDGSLTHGWGIPTATDIALAWLVARMVFGKGHPAVSFLLLLAVADDAIGLGIIAVFYPDPAHPVQPLWLVAVLAGMLAAGGLNKLNVKSPWLYLIGPGVLSWYALHSAHLHPALALVAIVPFMPHATHDEGLFVHQDGAPQQRDTLNNFERAFRLPVDLGLFAFGLANAAVPLSGVGDATIAVLVALLVGKTFGIFGFSLLAERFGFPLPQGMNRRSLFVAGITGALGLTVALFVAGVAFTDPGLMGAAKMGALGSAIAAPVALIAGRLLRVREVDAVAKTENQGPVVGAAA